MQSLAIAQVNDTLCQEISSLMSLTRTDDLATQLQDNFDNEGDDDGDSDHGSNGEQEDEEGDDIRPTSTAIAPLKVTKSTTRYGQAENVKQTCPNCRSTEVRLTNGNFICYDCCCLLESVMDEAGEWKSYQNDSTSVSNPRCSIQVNPYLPETSCHTFIKAEGGDRYGQKLQQMSNWMVPHHEKSLNIRLHDINYYGSLCNLPGNVIDFAKQVYVEFIELQPIHKKKKSSRGDCHNAIIAVILLISCKEFSIRRSPDDICNRTGLTTTDFTKAGNLVFSVLQHSHLLDISHHQYIVRSSDYINSFCHTIGLNDSVLIAKIYEIEEKVHSMKLLQKNTPQAIACGCIYFVTKMMGIKIDRRDFENKCSVSLPTLNKVYDNLIQHTDQIIS